MITVTHRTDKTQINGELTKVTKYHDFHHV